MSSEGAGPMRTVWLLIQFSLALTVVVVSFAAGVCWGASRVAAAMRSATWLRGFATATPPLPLAKRVCGSSDVVDVTHQPQLVVVEEPCPN